MTVVRMNIFGVDVVRKTDLETGKLLDIYEIPRAVYKNPPGYKIESDASSATYPLAIAAITYNYEFSNNTKSGPDPKAVVQEVSRLFKHVIGQSPNYPPNLAQAKKSYFLSLTYPDIKLASPHIDEITTGADTLELRVDLLRDQDSFDKIGPHIPSKAYVVSQLATSLSIVFAVRTVSQGGSFPDTAEAEAFELFDLAVHAGVEYIDAEISWSAKRASGLISKKGQTEVIASRHGWSGKLAWGGTEVKQKYQDADKFGDIVKIVGKANTFEDNFALHSFVKKLRRP